MGLRDERRLLDPRASRGHRAERRLPASQDVVRVDRLPAAPARRLTTSRTSCSRAGSKRGLHVLERDEAARRREDHADRIETQVLRERAIRRRALREPLPRHPPEPFTFSRPDRVERTRGTATRSGQPRLHLAEDERALVGCNEIELAEAGAEVTREDAVAAVLEVLLRDRLAELAVPSSEVDCHGGEATRGCVTAGLRTQKLRYRWVTFP